jgi:Matrixin
MIATLSLLIVTGLVLQACAGNPNPETPCNFVQNSQLQRVSWGSEVPVVLYIDSSVPNQYFDDIKSAADVWNKQIGREVIKIGGWVDTDGKPTQDSHNVIYYMNTWEDEKDNEQARTTVYWAGDRIYEADVRLNAKDFTFSHGQNLTRTDVDMESLVLHEFGHVLGLAHSAAPQSVMARSLPNNTARRSLSANDQESIRCEY